MANNKIAIIGGSGLYDVQEFKDREFIKLDSPWGKPSDEILNFKYKEKVKKKSKILAASLFSPHHLL